MTFDSTWPPRNRGRRPIKKEKRKEGRNVVMIGLKISSVRTAWKSHQCEHTHTHTRTRTRTHTHTHTHLSLSLSLSLRVRFCVKFFLPLHSPVPHLHVVLSTTSVPHVRLWNIVYSFIPSFILSILLSFIFFFFFSPTHLYFPFPSYSFIYLLSPLIITVLAKSVKSVPINQRLKFL